MTALDVTAGAIMSAIISIPGAALSGFGEDL